MPARYRAECLRLIDELLAFRCSWTAPQRAMHGLRWDETRSRARLELRNRVDAQQSWVHAPDPEMALVLAKEQFTRRDRRAGRPERRRTPGGPARSC